MENYLIWKDFQFRSEQFGWQFDLIWRDVCFRQKWKRKEGIGDVYFVKVFILKRYFFFFFRGLFWKGDFRELLI